MPEGEFSADPMDQDLEVEPLDQPSDDSFVGDDGFEDSTEPSLDTPNLTLSDVESAVLALITSNPDTTAKTRTDIDYDSNARAALKNLIRYGLVNVTPGGYEVTDTGQDVLISHGLVDAADPTTLTKLGKLMRRRYFM